MRIKNELLNLGQLFISVFSSFYQFAKEQNKRYLVWKNGICGKLLESRWGWDNLIDSFYYLLFLTPITYECSLLRTFSILPVDVFQINTDPSLPPAHAYAQSGERTAFTVSVATLKSSWLNKNKKFLNQLKSSC
jgi:hypothetical protein